MERQKSSLEDDIYTLGMKHGFSMERTQELHDSFSVFDKNGDGVITTEEIGTVMTSLGQRPTRDELRALMHSVDGNHNELYIWGLIKTFVETMRYYGECSKKDSGTIEFEEFLEIFARKLNIDPEKELHEVFSVFDQNKDGFISPPELFTVLTKLGELITQEEAEEMVKEADLNGDGKVDYSEFKTILKWK